MSKNAVQLIHQDSRNVERFTPPFITGAARRTMGGIELDPASCAAANQFVGALRYHTKEDDGLSRDWEALTLWMNHPFSREGNPLWIDKLIHHFKRRDIGVACCICFTATSEGWFSPLFDFWRCYLSPRTNYINANGNEIKGAPKGSVVTYLGDNISAFCENFLPLGNIEPPAIRKRAIPLRRGNTMVAQGIAL